MGFLVRLLHVSFIAAFFFCNLNSSSEILWLYLIEVLKQLRVFSNVVVNFSGKLANVHYLLKDFSLFSDKLRLIFIIINHIFLFVLVCRLFFLFFLLIIPISIFRDIAIEKLDDFVFTLLKLFLSHKGLLRFLGELVRWWKLICSILIVIELLKVLRNNAWRKVWIWEPVFIL